MAALIATQCLLKSEVEVIFKNLTPPSSLPLPPSLPLPSFYLALTNRHSLPHPSFLHSSPLIYKNKGNLGNKVINLGNYMRECLIYPDQRVMQMAVSCLSTLSSREGTLVADFVEGEIKRSFDALEGGGEMLSRSSSQVFFFFFSFLFLGHSIFLNPPFLFFPSPSTRWMCPSVVIQQLCV